MCSPGRISVRAEIIYSRKKKVHRKHSFLSYLIPLISKNIWNIKWLKSTFINKIKYDRNINRRWGLHLHCAFILYISSFILVLHSRCCQSLPVLIKSRITGHSWREWSMNCVPCEAEKYCRSSLTDRGEEWGQRRESLLSYLSGDQEVLVSW